MLTPYEKECASELLKGLPIEELLQLAKTVTKPGCLDLDPVNEDEAIELIVKYETSVKSLLNRKKITKPLLSHYLHWKNIEFSVNYDKIVLSKIILKLWKEVNTNPQAIKRSVENVQSSVVTTVTAGNSNVCTVSSTNNNLVAVPEVSSCVPFENELNTMALKFTEWFYSMVNEEFWQKGNTTLTNDHFYSDSLTVVKLLSGADSVVQESTDGAALIRGTCREHGLLMQPNLSLNGVRGISEPHGAVLILACGTLHKAPDLCVGLFEQVFSLVKDPLSCDNWKIKQTELRLKNAPQTKSYPTLLECELTKDLVPL